jgi:hypothetical protein
MTTNDAMTELRESFLACIFATFMENLIREVASSRVFLPGQLKFPVSSRLGSAEILTDGRIVE